MDEAFEALAAKTWEEVEAVEHEGAIYFPDVLMRRRADGSKEETKVMLKPLREYERRKARLEARQWAQSEKLDPETDADLFDNMDTVCRLAIGIRSSTPPYEPLEPNPRRLERTYDPSCFAQLYGKLEAYERLVDPRDSDFSAEGVVALAAAIAAKRHIAPLHGFDGRSQSDFIVGMADLLMSFLRSKFSQESSESSTPDP